MKGLPAVTELEDEPHVTVTMIGCGATVTLAEPEAVTPFESVTLKLSVKVPFAGCVTENDPVPEYGAVPPVAETVQVKGLPVVIAELADPQVTVTTRG